MRWLLMALFLVGFTPIHTDYDNKEKIKEEFRNIESSVQDQEFTIYRSTPIPNDLKDGQIVIFSSGAVKIMLRAGQEIYSVNVSCITIRR